jgi:4-amino-4-deoxy-L-arabinose transferase-like glycosyltransferase
MQFETSLPPKGGSRRLVALLLALSAIFVVVGFVHLRADFPNGSPWQDWSKMTDEGWYGSAAVQQVVFGHWFLPGSFNPAVAMPVWPAMLSGWFALTGMSMIAARTLTMVFYAGSLALFFALLRRQAGGATAALAVLLTAANPFCYAFDRLAVLEPLTVFWLMLTFWLAARTSRHAYGKLALVGLLLAVQVLTKPTGVALVPGVLYLLWANWGWPRRPFGQEGWLLPIVLVCSVAAVGWLAYFGLVVRPHYLPDYKLLFSVNDYRAHLSIVPKMALVTLRDGQWIQPVLWPVAVVIAVLSAFRLRGLWRTPVFGAALIAALGHLAYVGYHTNFQPRYYLVVAMPMAIVIALGVSAVWRNSRGWVKPALVLGLAATLVWMGIGTTRYALHPEYSFLTAAQSIATVVRAEGGEHPLLLSDSGADIALMTGLPGINEQYTTDGLDALLARYHPGWYAAWLNSERVAIKQVGQRYRLLEVARYRVFDDPTRQVLVLYKLMPRTP